MSDHTTSDHTTSDHTMSGRTMSDHTTSDHTTETRALEIRAGVPALVDTSSETIGHLYAMSCSQSATPRLSDL
jgi:hypothetical protein